MGTGKGVAIVTGAERVASGLGDGAAAWEHDIRSLESWERLLDDVCRTLGDDVGALVNNAARTEVRSFWEIDPTSGTTCSRRTCAAPTWASASSAPTCATAATAAAS